MSRETLSGPHHSGGVASGVLHAVAAQIREQVAAYCESTKVPGYVVGVYHDGAETVVAHGLANVVTGAPMREDTGFLFGSVTKVLTATLVLQQVERGIIDLAERVIRYLPEFQLTTPGAAEKIRVRHLLTHTSGIDADLFFPDAQGSGALSAFLDGLGRHCGSLFEPDEFISYSNGGMIVAGRLLEVLTGTSYHELLKRELYATVGMDDSSISAEEAILRSTAVGHFPVVAANGVRRTDMFKLPDSWAPAGSTPIGTISDLLAFGRTHLAHGVSPSGKRVLSPESTTRMQAVSHDMGTANVPRLGSDGRWCRSGQRPCCPSQGPRQAEWRFCLSCLNTTWPSRPLAMTRGRWRFTISCCSGCFDSTSPSRCQTSQRICPRTRISRPTRARTARTNSASTSAWWTANSRRP
jgi:CubicO group peptidase (beta-lactamase class C family)